MLLKYDLFYNLLSREKMKLLDFYKNKLSITEKETESCIYCSHKEMNKSTKMIQAM